MELIGTISNRRSLQVKKVIADDIQSTIKKIESGTFDRNDVRVLLINMRDYVSGEQIEEIANFVAHPQIHTSGETYKYFERSVNSFVKMQQNGGQWFVQKA